GIIAGMKTVAALEDPVGKVRAGWKRPNGLFIEAVTVPLGVAAIIYESRPNVTADAASLAYKAGCAILLRGSRAALESNRSLVGALKAGLEAGGGLPGRGGPGGFGGPGGGGPDPPGQGQDRRGYSPGGQGVDPPGG
ncbi:MAG: hypothetical protein LBP42_03715, partial [Treponema sp.]|nr:hypothetical protein [Treponema sp.]